MGLPNKVHKIYTCNNVADDLMLIGQVVGNPVVGGLVRGVFVLGL